MQIRLHVRICLIGTHTGGFTTLPSLQVGGDIRQQRTGKAVIGQQFQMLLLVQVGGLPADTMQILSGKEPPVGQGSDFSASIVQIVSSTVIAVVLHLPPVGTAATIKIEHLAFDSGTVFAQIYQMIVLQRNVIQREGGVKAFSLPIAVQQHGVVVKGNMMAAVIEVNAAVGGGNLHADFIVSDQHGGTGGSCGGKIDAIIAPDRTDAVGTNPFSPYIFQTDAVKAHTAFAYLGNQIMGNVIPQHILQGDSITVDVGEGVAADGEIGVPLGRRGLQPNAIIPS